MFRYKSFICIKSILKIWRVVIFYYVSHGLHELEGRSSAIHRRQRLPKGVKNTLKEGWKYVSRKKDGERSLPFLFIV